MSELSERITKYATEYYEGNPSISDQAFDSLVDKLRKEEPSNPVLSQVGWGYVVNSTYEDTKPHRYEVAKFEGKVRQASQIGLNSSNAQISMKIDGGSICCYYTNGFLDYAITRGDGYEGFDVTKKMKFIIPSELKDKSFSGMVRGEIALKNSIFNSKYKDDYSSARNLAIGMIKRNNIPLYELKELSFVAYTVRGNSKPTLDSKTKVFEWLANNGFEVVDTIKIDKWTDDSLGNIIKSYNKYLADGIVITSEKYDEQKDGSYVPVREVAYKTKANTAVVTVTDIEWSLTRTGRLFPRVWFTPVELSGATVSKATAFHAQFVKDEGIGIGSELRIQRSGEVIPDIVEVITRKDYELPKVCPECGKELIQEGPHLYCRNPNCSGTDYASVFRWINIIAPVKGLGNSWISTILDELEINNIDDLYKKLDLIPSVFNEGSSTQNKVKEMVKYLKESVDMSDFLLACNIPMLGGAGAEELSKYRDLILEDKIDNNWKSKILELHAGNITAREGVANNVDKLRRYATYIEVKKYEEKKVSSEKKDSNKFVTITGKLSKSRSDFVEEISKYGWSEGPIKKAKYLITDNFNSNSSKAKTARELGITMITESDFRLLMTK